MTIKTYPEMNETVKNLLRWSDEPMKLYILARIEELERQVEYLTPPPNDPLAGNRPLTLEELREMDGEPVWVVEGALSYHALISGVFDAAVWLITRWDEREMLNEDYGQTWSAYRRKPEGGDTNA